MITLWLNAGKAQIHYTMYETNDNPTRGEIYEQF